MGIANGNSGTVDDFGVVVHEILLTGFPNKSPLLVNVPPHMFFRVPELVMVPRTSLTIVA